MHQLSSASPHTELLQEALHAAGLSCDQFDEIEGKARAAARMAAAAEERVARLEEEVAMLRLELASRPTQVLLNWGLCRSAESSCTETMA